MSDELRSAYGEPYDPYPALEAWERRRDGEATAELWEKLHHQNDVNTASYAAVIDLARMIGASEGCDWNAYALMATIEECRALAHNPPVPSALADAYDEAWAGIIPPALRDLASAEDDVTVRAVLAVICHAKGQHSLGAIALLTEEERQEIL